MVDERTTLANIAQPVKEGNGHAGRLKTRGFEKAVDQFDALFEMSAFTVATTDCRMLSETTYHAVAGSDCRPTVAERPPTTS